MKKNFEVIGLMSGTSLDGLDIAFCEFRLNNNKWEFDIIQAETEAYSQVWINLLREAPLLDGLSLTQLNVSYGHWIGQTVNQFIRKYRIQPKLIASHGHTIFHRPQERMTLQIGSGAAIAAETGIITVNDFRSLDIAYGGQGAPLVPIGDKLLFSDYNACVNIGGFANISFDSPTGERTAYDICPTNIVLNSLAEKLGAPFDASGLIAQGGKCDSKLLKKLDDLDFYKKRGPKSLGREWVEKMILPLINESNLSVEDLLATYTTHAAGQISRNLPTMPGSKAIITGGGAYNTFLIKKIAEQSSCRVIIPESGIINFKESLIFAFLGVLRMEGRVNCLADATGARCNSSSGSVHLPKAGECI
ncbi:MAG: anhydro-N-acetylmuramic acid kinase [Lentimicrobiaceae bacterium]